MLEITKTRGVIMEKKTKCSGKIDFFWAFEKYSTDNYSDRIGLNRMELANMQLVTTRIVPILKYGKNKTDKVLLNFCPFCGENFKEKLER
jgi:hypothetical protein